MAKRIFLFALVNILVMVTLTLILGLLRVGCFFPTGGLAGLAVFCLVWGFAGALISLALSRLMAKWFMGVRVMPPDTTDPELKQLVETVHGLARAGPLLRGHCPKVPAGKRFRASAFGEAAVTIAVSVDHIPDRMLSIRSRVGSQRATGRTCRALKSISSTPVISLWMSKRLKSFA